MRKVFFVSAMVFLGFVLVLLSANNSIQMNVSSYLEASENQTTSFDSNETMYRYDLGRTSYYPDGPDNLETLYEKWRVDTGWTDQGSVIVDDNYCYWTIDRYLYVRDKVTGELVWSVIGGYTYFPAIVAENLVGVYDAHGINMYNKFTGEWLWYHPLASWSPTCPPLIYKGKVFINSGPMIYCLDALTGNEIWSYEMNTAPSTTVAWDMVVSNQSGTLFVSAMYALFAFNTENGSVQWQKEVTWDYKSLLLTADGILFGHRKYYDDFIDKIDITNGDIVNTFTVDGDVLTPVSFNNNLLYFVMNKDSGEDFLYCIEIVENNMSLKWEYPVSYDTGHYSPTPSISKNTVYVYNQRGDEYSIVCVDAATGEFKKEYFTGASWGAFPMNIFLRDRKIYFSNGQSLYCLDEKPFNSNEAMHRYDLGRTSNYTNGPQQPPLNLDWSGIASDTQGGGNVIAANGKIYVGSTGKIYCYDEATYTELWNYDIVSQLNDSLLSKIAVARNYDATPSVDYLYFVTKGLVNYEYHPKIVALDASNGQLKWTYTYDGNGYTYGGPAVYNGVLYIGIGPELHAINASNGSLKWKRNLGGPMHSCDPVVANGIVFAYGDYNGDIAAFNAQTGTELWRNASHPETQGLLHYNNTLYSVGGFGIGDAIVAVNPDTGQVIDSYNYSPQYFASHNICAYGNKIYYVGSDVNTGDNRRLVALHKDTLDPVFIGNLPFTNTASQEIAVSNNVVYISRWFLDGQTPSRIEMHDATTGQFIDEILFGAYEYFEDLYLNNRKLFVVGNPWSSYQNNLYVYKEVPDTTPPVFGQVPAQVTVTATQPQAQFTFTAADPENSPFGVAIYNPQPGMLITSPTDPDGSETYVDRDINGDPVRYPHNGPGPFTFSWIPPTSGTYTVWFWAIDEALNYDYKTVTINADIAPPAISIITPVNGSSTTNRRPQFRATISDNNAIKRLVFLRDNVLIQDLSINGAVSSTTMYYTPQSDLSYGWHTYTLKLWDMVDNYTEATTTFRVYYSGGGGGGCFLAGTPITMADGSTKPIEQLKVGDTLLAFDEKTATFRPDAIKQVFVIAGEKEYLIINGHIKVTPHHRFYVKDHWVEAGDLAVGDMLLNANSQPIAIASIEHVAREVTVYNLDVNPYDTFIAGGIVVHNAEGYGDNMAYLQAANVIRTK